MGALYSSLLFILGPAICLVSPQGAWTWCKAVVAPGRTFWCPMKEGEQYFLASLVHDINNHNISSFLVFAHFAIKRQSILLLDFGFSHTMRSDAVLAPSLLSHPWPLPWEKHLWDNRWFHMEHSCVIPAGFPLDLRPRNVRITASTSQCSSQPPFSWKNNYSCLQ